MLRRSQAKGTIAKYYTEIKPAEEVPHQGLFIDANCCLNQEYTQWIGEPMQTDMTISLICNDNFGVKLLFIIYVTL